MRISVDHISRYSYDPPVRSVVQSHRLTPAQCDNQRIESWLIELPGGLEGGSFTDGAGDRVQGWTIPGPVSEVSVRVRGIVETTDCAGVLRGHRERIPQLAWLRLTAPTAPDAALSALARGISAADPLALAHALCGAVGAAIAYRPGVTHAHTTAAEALALGEGVCQDHTHALIACARLHDLPARYVSGYLQASEDGSPHEAAHAWAEIWIEGLGWVGFDASNNCCPDERYIRLGCGFDARDAAPIRGIARGGGVESLEVSVAVEAAQQ
ncbi:MAG: transglutaminase family protein [Pararhodobacter sp.]|nr:transglutaminase family protein [Pararhodobacter sp.]